jgi:hypothetical protein
MLLSTSLALLSLSAVQPLAGESVSGTIAFPRPQQMSIAVMERGRLALRLGFDGRCAGGGLDELWMSFVPSHGTLRVRDGAFSGRLSGTARKVGGVSNRSARFTWNVSGRFTDHQVATATVSGTAVVRAGNRVVSRCEIGREASARLTHGG